VSVSCATSGAGSGAIKKTSDTARSPRRGSPALAHGMLQHARYAAEHLPRCALPASRFDPGLELTGVRCADADGCEEARCTAMRTVQLSPGAGLPENPPGAGGSSGVISCMLSEPSVSGPWRGKLRAEGVGTNVVVTLCCQARTAASVFRGPNRLFSAKLQQSRLEVHGVQKSKRFDSSRLCK